MATIEQIRELVGPNTIRYVDEKRLYEYGYDTLELRLDQLTQAIDDKKSQWLDMSVILPHVRALLIDPVFMKYTLEHIDPKTDFHLVYEEMFINGRVYFTQINDPYKQFALGWLYTRYH